MTLITATTRLSRELQREYDREAGGGRSFDVADSAHPSVSGVACRTLG